MARRSIMSELFTDYSYDCRHIVLLNPQVLFMGVCPNGGVYGCKEIEGLDLSGSIFMCNKVALLKQHIKLHFALVYHLVVSHRG